MRQVMMGFGDGIGVSWTICKQSAPRLKTDNHTNTSSLAFHRPDETDNHTNTSSLAFHRPDALPGAQPTVSAH